MTYPTDPTSVITRFWSLVDSSAGPDECWIWQGAASDRSGYGKFRVDNRQVLAHRWILGLVLGRPLRWDDKAHEEACHLCDNPPCVNPAHLYLGDRNTNMADVARRGRGVNPVAKANAAKTHCPHGHEYDDANTYWYRGARQCKACSLIANRRYYRQKRANRDDATSGRASS